MFATASVALSAPAAASAETFVVKNTNDSGSGSLRDAIALANAVTGEDRIDATGVTGAIDLVSSLPEITEPVRIVGPGPDLLTVRRTMNPVPQFRILNFNQAQEARISGLTLHNGSTQGGGGAIQSVNTTLRARNLRVIANLALAGGGIHVNGGEALIEDVLLEGNWATFGGGLSVANGAAVTLVRSALTGNNAGEAGGGVFANAGATHVTVRASTIASNKVTTAEPEVPGGGGIGAVNNSTGQILVESSTIAGNSALVGSALQPGGSQMAVRSTIIAEDDACAQAVASLGYNIAADPSCGLGQPTDQVGVDPMLEPLADNGGPTPTMLPQPGSPAIDQGFAGDLEADQRGLPRADFKAIENAEGGDGADVGAAEVQDQQPPALTLKKTKVNAKRRSVKLRFKATDDAAGKIQFRCKLDKKKFKACRSPVAYKRLKPGRHRIVVRAVDAGGNTAKAAVRFKVRKRRK